MYLVLICGLHYLAFDGGRVVQTRFRAYAAEFGTREEAQQWAAEYRAQVILI